MISDCCRKGHLTLIVVDGQYRAEYAYCSGQWKYWRSWTIGPRRVKTVRAMGEVEVQEGARAVWRAQRRLPIPWMWMPVWWRQRRRRAFEAGLRAARLEHR